MCHDKEIINSWVAAIYLFQFGILLPVSIILNVEIAYVILTALLLIISLFNNNFQFNIIFILVTIFIVIYLLSSFLIFDIPTSVSLMIMIGFIGKGLSALYITSVKLNYSELYKSFKTLAWINLIILGLGILLLDLENNVGYMRLGYALIPSTLILLGQAIYFKFSLKTFTASVGSILLLLLYGNRGVFLVLILFIIMMVLFAYRKNIKSIIIIASSILIFYIMMTFNIFSKIILFIYRELDIYSYSLMKFTTTIEDGLIDASSGRDYLYITGFKNFLESPLMGNGVGFTFTYSTTTAHNIVLQILIESGLIGILFTIILSIYFIYCLSKINNKYTIFLVIFLFSLSIGRLSVSSDLWLRTELWLLIGLMISIINFKRNKVANNNLGVSK